MEKYGLVAEFYNYKTGEDNYTFYEEVQYDSYEEAAEAIDDEAGEQIISFAQIDIKNEPDLRGYTFEGIAPYLIEPEPVLS